MKQFEFATTTETKVYCEEILRCMQQYGFMSSREAALELMNRYWAGEDFSDCDLRLHEDPYYWALSFLHGIWGDNLPDWWKDPSLWPPPQDFRDRWWGQTDSAREGLTRGKQVREAVAAKGILAFIRRLWSKRPR